MSLKFFVSSAFAVGLTMATIPVSAKAMQAASPVTIAQAAAPLTEESIQTVVDQLQAARVSKDIEGTLALIAPFAVTVVTVRSGDGSATVTNRLEGLEAHRQMLGQSFSEVRNRESLENYVIINLIDDNFGIAKIYQMENFETPKGEAFIVASQTVLRLSQVNGQVLITSATVDGWLAARPPQN